MTKSIASVFILVFLLNYCSYSQGPFVGASVDKKGNVGFKAGWSYMSIVEASVNYAPISLNEAGYIGGSVKAPIKFSVLKDNYSSAFYWGIFLSYTGGMIEFPKPPPSAMPLSNLKKYGGAPSMLLEFTWIGSGLAIAFPVELGYGKLNFNQDFATQYNDAENKYELKSTLYLSTGLKFFFSKNHCKSATAGLKIGY